jgi:MerR family transcriptional regulator, light-induced transcriptional regulator
MAYGRTTFSEDLGSARAFLAGSEPSDGRFDQSKAQQTQFGPASKAAVARSPKPLVDIADPWIIESIDRKRTALYRTDSRFERRITTFVETLFDEQSDRYKDMGAALVKAGADPQKVAGTLFEPALRIINQLRRADRCDALKATIAISRMQRLFRQMVAEDPPVLLPDLGRRALLAPVPCAPHSFDLAVLFGLSVVDDAFCRAGWDVDCCGCDEKKKLLRLVAVNHYQIVGVTVDVEQSLSDIGGLIRKLRSRSSNKSVVLVASGSMVIQNPQRAVDAGFDLLAIDAYSAVALADSVVSLNVLNADRRAAAE